jgi:hypothetical protein
VKELKNIIGVIANKLLRGDATNKNQPYRLDGVEPFFLMQEGVTTSEISTDNTKYYLDNCPTLSTIIGLKASAFSNGNPEVLNFNTDNYVRGRFKEWEKFMRSPNPLQTGRVFRHQLYSYIQAYNFCPVLILPKIGFDVSPPEMWVIPPHLCEIKINSKYLFCNNVMDMIDSIHLKYNKTKTELSKEYVTIFTGMGMSLENLVHPDSNLKPLKYPITNIIRNLEARGVIAANRGAAGILTNVGNDPIGRKSITRDEREALQKDYSLYGLREGQKQLIITNASLNFQQIGLNIRDMMLLEMEQADVTTIADAFHYPSVLLPKDKGTTYSNQIGAERKFYQNTIIPESLHFIEQLNKRLKTEEIGIKIELDYTHLPSMQEDEKLKAQVRVELGRAVTQEFMMGIITWNEVKKALGQDIVQGMDLYVYELPKDYLDILLKTNANGESDTKQNTDDTDGESQYPARKVRKD